VKKFYGFLPVVFCAAALIVSACDLQPKIMSLPDSVGDFISNRYPALLADPETQPEIYNSAASDYGVYASPELYGSVDADDYLLYSDINDYMFPAQEAAAPVVGDEESEPVIVGRYDAPAADTRQGATTPAPDDFLVVPMYGAYDDTHVVTVANGETLYTISRRYGTSVEDLARMNNISAPYSLRAGQQLRIPGNGDIVAVPSKSIVTQPPVSVAATEKTKISPTPARVSLQEVTVSAGDTLYSISRAYSVPVNDLAVMNDLAAPFRLTVGQKIKVPNLHEAAVKAAAVQSPVSAAVPSGGKNTTSGGQIAKTTATNKNSNEVQKNQTAVKKNQPQKKEQNTASKPVKKISSDPKQKLPAIAARSSSKFSWPVRGKILSGFGSKPNGLVNDGINIAASRGATVKAAENGVVAYAGNEVKGMGNLIIIQHSGGWMTVYAHLDTMAVRRGTRVNVGQKIGTVGASGKVDRPQLHFEIRKGTKAYNPSQYLKK